MIDEIGFDEVDAALFERDMMVFTEMYTKGTDFEEAERKASKEFRAMREEENTMADNQLEYNFPVYGTQGGGLVREVGEKFIFVEAPPDFQNLTVGSEMPDEWGTVPANELARQHEDDF